jgi:hypothetical protein
MFKSLLRFFGLAKKSSERDNFDPLYGLPKPSFNEWLSRNPKLKRDYASQLAARGATRRKVAHRRSTLGTVVC